MRKLGTSMINSVIFDLDGTLLDTREGIVESVKYTINKMGYNELPLEKLLRFVGPPIQKSFIENFGCDEETAQVAADVFRNYYKSQALLKAQDYPGIYDLCKILKDNDIKMAVATYKREDYALKLLRHFGFDKFCNPMRGADNNNVLKKKDIVEMCIREMNVDCENVTLVGDTDNDAIGAEMAGVSFIGVTYGFGFKSKVDVDKYSNIGIANTPLDIAKIVLEGAK